MNAGGDGLCRRSSRLLLRTLALYEPFPAACLPVDIWAAIARWWLNLMASGLTLCHTARLPQPLTASSQAEPCPRCTHTHAADTAYHKLLSHIHEQYKWSDPVLTCPLTRLRLKVCQQSSHPDTHKQKSRPTVPSVARSQPCRLLVPGPQIPGPSSSWLPDLSPCSGL